MKNLGIGVLELFAEIAEQYTEVRARNMTVGYVPVITQDRAKRRWAEENKDLQRLYDRRYYYLKRGRPEEMPPIRNATRVEIFFDGNGYYYAKPNDSERLGGPFDTIHKAWKHADKNRNEVIAVTKTPGIRSHGR